MANDYFQFRQFTVCQDRCGMKVGTDGTLLGAWARGGKTILDIGTGTGLIALMMAQRFPSADITAIDIDDAAVAQALGNVARSPFRNIRVAEADVRTFQGRCFEAVVSNPPFFVDSLTSPDHRRTVARHAASLTYRDLMEAACQLLADDGELSVVVPSETRTLMEQEAVMAGFFKVRQCAVRTTPRKPPRRYLLAFRRHPAPLELSEAVIETSPGHRSPWYQQLTKDFYL